MPNVNPGDLARIILDPNSHDGHSNVRKQVHIINFPENMTYFEKVMVDIMARKFGHMQLAVALEPVWAGALAGPRELSSPGEVLLLPDAHLRRIDPPADTKDVFTDAPTSADRRPMEELADHRLYIKEPVHGTPHQS